MIHDCDNCKHAETPAFFEPCASCGGNSYWEPEVKTNYDRIISMKPEALAIAICSDFGGIPWCKNIPECQDSLCVWCVVKWLKQEIKEDK